MKRFSSMVAAGTLALCLAGVLCACSGEDSGAAVDQGTADAATADSQTVSSVEADDLKTADSAPAEETASANGTADDQEAEGVEATVDAVNSALLGSWHVYSIEGPKGMKFDADVVAAARRMGLHAEFVFFDDGTVQATLASSKAQRGTWQEGDYHQIEIRLGDNSDEVLSATLKDNKLTVVEEDEQEHETYTVVFAKS